VYKRQMLYLSGLRVLKTTALLSMMSNAFSGDYLLSP
jgi:hypothetical protein